MALPTKSWELTICQLLSLGKKKLAAIRRIELLGRLSSPGLPRPSQCKGLGLHGPVSGGPQPSVVVQNSGKIDSLIF
jgi:hypothetical protein